MRSMKIVAVALSLILVGSQEGRAALPNLPRMLIGAIEQNDAATAMRSPILQAPFCVMSEEQIWT